MSSRNTYKQITSFKQYIQLTDINEREHGHIIYNVMMFPGEAEKLIDAGKLYCEKLNCGLAIYRCEQDFDKLYLYIDETGEPNIPPKEKPVIIEFIYISRLPNNDAEQLESRIKNGDFDFHVKNIRRKMKTEMFVRDEIEKSIEQAGCRLGKAGLRDVKAIIGLWQNSLDRCNSIILTEDEIIQAVHDSELVCIYKGDCVKGVAHLRRENKKTGSIWLVAVSSEMRGLGLGKLLMKAVLVEAAEAGAKNCFIWTDEKNIVMSKTLESIGFVPDGMTSVEYIYKTEGEKR